MCHLTLFSSIFFIFFSLLRRKNSPVASSLSTYEEFGQSEKHIRGQCHVGSSIVRTAPPDLAVWLRGRERRVLLHAPLLLGLLALGEVLVAEVWQESLPVLYPQLGVLGQLLFNHQRLTVPVVSRTRKWKGGRVEKGKCDTCSVDYVTVDE